MRVCKCVPMCVRVCAYLYPCVRAPILAMNIAGTYVHTHTHTHTHLLARRMRFFSRTSCAGSSPFLGTCRAKQDPAVINIRQMFKRRTVIHGAYSRTVLPKEKKNYAGSKTLPASIMEKETHWPKVP